MFDHVAAGVTLDCRICSLFFTMVSVSCVNQVNVGMSRPKFQFIVARNLSTWSLVYAVLITSDCSLKFSIRFLTASRTERNVVGGGRGGRGGDGRRADVNPFYDSVVKMIRLKDCGFRFWGISN